jgi:putative CocE/NonD family hydrolase
MLAIRTDFDQRVPMHDGVTLSADVYRPDDGEPHPVILMRTPYVKANSVTADTARYYAGNGYVFVAMDVRGRGDSGGDFLPYRNDGRDGYDAVEWCASQHWSTGDVGTLGSSYSGHIQWLTAVLQPPHLRCMIAAVTPSDPFVETPTGTPGPMHICWFHMTSGRVMQPTDGIEWMRVYETLPLRAMPETLGRHLPGWQEELDHDRLDDWWRALSYQDKYEQVTVPVLHVSGWYDDELIGTPLNFGGMVERGGSDDARRHQKLLIGPWPHQVNSTSKLGEVDFGPQGTIDLRGYYLRFFDRWLKGEGNGVDTEPPVHIYIMGDNRWYDAESWPLPGTDFTAFYLHSGGEANSKAGDGTLSTSAPGEEPADSYRYDPARPVPFITDAVSNQIGGPDDYAAIQRRDDVLVYASEPLTEDLTVIGPVRLELYASSSAPDTDFMAMLLDVHPSGFAQRLCDGMVRARYREGMDRPSLIEPGRVYCYDVDLWDTSQVFKAGHRIALQIASSAFPKYDRNLNTGGSLADESEMRTADQRIYHDASHPSRLVLPLARV